MADRIMAIDWNAPVRSGAAVWRLKTTIVAIAAGDNHNLLLTEEGTVLATGGNSYGETSVPHNLNKVVAIAAGFAHSIALRQNGTVVAWGNNATGATDVPPGLADVVAISAGAAHSAAVRRDVTVVVWGQTESVMLESPRDLVDATSVVSGADYCLAIRAGGTVAAWGKIGREASAPGTAYVRLPDDLTGVVGIDGNARGWVAVKNDGTLVTSGRNSPPDHLNRVEDPRDEGFGRHQWSSHTVPLDLVTLNPWSSDRGSNGRQTPHPPLTGVVQVVVSERHAIARRKDGALVSWGTRDDCLTLPYGLRDITAVSAGRLHSLALRSDGSVITWGVNGARLRGPLGSAEEFVGWQRGSYNLPSLMV